MYDATIPSFVARPTRFAALAMPFVRRIVSALSRSPPDSASARLQSMMPALVFSRRVLTSCGLTSLMVRRDLRFYGLKKFFALSGDNSPPRGFVGQSPLAWGAPLLDSENSRAYALMPAISASSRRAG